MKKVYEIIVDQIIEKLEQWTIPWKKSWQWGVPINYSSNREYKWINRLILSMNDFKTNYYLTYKQVKILWWNIKSWSKATKIIYWDIIDNKEELVSSDHKENNKQIFTKYYNVFNIEQTDILPSENITEQVEQDIDYNKSKSILSNYKDKPKIVKWTNPCYIPNSDTIQIPNIELFTTKDEFYSTLFHEMIHSTGNKTRLAREWIISKNNFWSNNYSTEELIAEIWSMFLSNYAWIENTVIDNQISYIQGWLTYLRGNKLEIIKASNQAEKAVAYIIWK